MNRFATRVSLAATLISAAALLNAPARASDDVSGTGAVSVRDAVIALSIAKAALPAAAATRHDLSVAGEISARRETAGAMAAMRPFSARRARPVSYERPVRLARYDSCSGLWCGRHAVLMLGVGY